MTAPRAAGTGSSVVVDRCQVCDNPDLQSALFIGYLPPVNQMRPIGQRPHEQPAYPAEFLYCPRCELVQLGLIVDPAVLFPPEYPYTSGTTKILRENFAELYTDCRQILPLTPADLVVDVGSNDGTLLGNFKNGGHRVRGIEPTLMANVANERGIPTTMSFFGPEAAARARAEDGPATIVTATNVFAHIEHVHEIVDSILTMLKPDGMFISESHYLMSLLETVQYDTIYHEHLRYYSLHSLKFLLERHGLEVIHAKRIPTHGGSIRVYSARKGTRPVQPSVAAVLAEERSAGAWPDRLARFKRDVVQSKLGLHALLKDLKQKGARIFGIGAPSRASTLINYAGLDDGIVDCVLEVKDSYKVGKYMPGTLIPVVDEARLFEDQPEYALLLSWHIAEELAPKLTAKGFKGRFIVPLPTPRIL
ncbi:MAG: class I SAM-dependent methyltransferase [Acidobacteria bacterium]|nr:class I SAM-dependent methyltransferase [Acidobacteriota bacterium]